MGWYLLAVAMVVAAAGDVGATSYPWLAHQLVNRVRRLDLTTHETDGVTVGAEPVSTAASLDGLRAYSNNGGDSTVSVIDAVSMTLIAAGLASIHPGLCAS